MSMSLTFYIGPYLECRVERVEVVEEYVGCTNPDCEYQAPRKTPGQEYPKFCGGCGSALGGINRPGNRSRVHWADASRAIREALSPDNCGSADFLYWIPNVRRDPPRDFFVREDVAIDLLDNDFSQFGEIVWLENAYKAEIATLAGLYGKGNLRTAWGVVAYTS